MDAITYPYPNPDAVLALPCSIVYCIEYALAPTLQIPIQFKSFICEVPLA